MVVGNYITGLSGATGVKGGLIGINGGTCYVAGNTVVDNRDTVSSSYGIVLAQLGSYVKRNTVVGSTYQLTFHTAVNSFANFYIDPSAGDNANQGLTALTLRQTPGR